MLCLCGDKGRGGFTVTPRFSFQLSHGNHVQKILPCHFHGYQSFEWCSARDLVAVDISRSSSQGLKACFILSWFSGRTCQCLILTILEILLRLTARHLGHIVRCLVRLSRATHRTCESHYNMLRVCGGGGGVSPWLSAVVLIVAIELVVWFCILSRGRFYRDAFMIISSPSDVRVT